MSTATKNYFTQGVEGREPAGFELLPATTEEGAPAGNLYLMTLETEVAKSGENSKLPGHPYVKFAGIIDEPEDFASRRVFGMFYWPTPVDNSLTGVALKKAEESHQKQMETFIWYVESILGVGVLKTIEDGPLEDFIEAVSEMLNGAAFVGKVGRESGQKPNPEKPGSFIRCKAEDPDMVYAPKNRITEFTNEESWTPEE